jgi:chromosome segregation ATPase
VTAPNITTLRHDVDIINGDKTVQGSIKKAIDDLYQLLMGGSSGQHIDYDTLNELANFVVEHEEFAEALEALAQQNKADIINLKAKDTVLEGRIATNANDIQDLKDSVLHVGADVENHEDRITDLETETSAIDGRLSTLEGWADIVNLDEIPILRDEVASLRSRVSAVETSISNLSTAVNGKASQSSVDALEARVAALEGAQYWALDGSTVYAKDSRSVRGAGFYDSTV